MFTHSDLASLQAQSLKMQGWIRQQTYQPGDGEDAAAVLELGGGAS